MYYVCAPLGLGRSRSGRRTRTRPQTRRHGGTEELLVAPGEGARGDSRLPPRNDPRGGGKAKGRRAKRVERMGGGAPCALRKDGNRPRASLTLNRGHNCLGAPVPLHQSHCLFSRICRILGVPASTEPRAPNSPPPLHRQQPHFLQRPPPHRRADLRGGRKGSHPIGVDDDQRFQSGGSLERRLGAEGNQARSVGLGHSSAGPIVPAGLTGPVA